MDKGSPTGKGGGQAEGRDPIGRLGFRLAGIRILQCIGEKTNRKSSELNRVELPEGRCRWTRQR